MHVHVCRPALAAHGKAIAQAAVTVTGPEGAATCLTPS